MNKVSAHSNSPRWMQAAVSALLPPTCREPVLGDLEERFNQRAPGRKWLGYVGDVVTTVPQVLRSQMRRIAVRGWACAVASGDLRCRAEQLQTRIWMRNACMILSIVLVIGAFLANARGAWHFKELVSLAMTIGWIGAAWQSYRVGGRSTGVPTSLSGAELRAFHRRELMRQMDLGAAPYCYWFVPAVLLILYAWTAVPGFHRAAFMLAAIGMQNGAIAWAYRKERSLNQRELDRMEQEIAEA